jgi:hypothetical protein
MKQALCWTRLVAGMALLALISCSGDSAAPFDSGPEPGRLAVTLVSPHADDGAVLISLRGPNIGEVLSADPSYQIFAANGEEDGELRLAVLGERVADVLVTFEVPDIRQATSYSATVINAADRANALRAETADYTLRIHPVH